ncbi:Transposable element P transposase [Frankliniella fusca]|uniref:Transposable element P transposase n=1 Tax=Frankliniella fusca TaxID=407009 RepID=A0AAE1LLU3_9NEOP|nr:Transposable element P transposase [Frankliniella fusca]
MHESLDKNCNIVYSTKHLKSGSSRPLFLIIDPPHLLKTIRNCMANSFAHRKTRQLWKNGETLSWEVFEKVYELTKTNKFRSHKLTKAHVKLTSFSCMTVSLATQAISNSVANCIEELAGKEMLQPHDTSELVKLIQLVNRFFDCLNGKEEENVQPRNADLAAYRSLNDPRFDFLENVFLKYFEDWKKDIITRPGIYTDTEKSRMIISHQSLEAIIITVKGLNASTKYMLEMAQAPKVDARVFNQDPLEQYFGKVRRKQGDNKQPLEKQVLDSRLKLHQAEAAALAPSKGNTSEGRGRRLELENSPLLSRKKPKKN